MTSSVGSYTPAVVIGTQSGWSNSPFTNAGWIVYPHTCSVSPADHSCVGTVIDEYYKLTFNLPSLACGQSVATPSAYCLSLDFMADNCVTEIFVNGVNNYLTSVSTPSGYTGFSLSNKVTVSLCNNWQAGTNTVIVHIVSGAFTSGGLSGFLAAANQTVNTTVGIPVSATSTQSNPICFGSTGSATITASGGISPYTYSWIPSGGTASVVTGLAAGNYSCIVTSSDLCSFTKTLTIVQPSATTLNIAANSPSACVGNSITLTATNSGGTPAYSYTWTAGPTSSSYITTRPAGNYIYTITSKDVNNCATTNTILLNFIPNPILNTSSISICQGAVGTLTVSGATSYTWYPTGFVGNSYTASPTSGTSYTVNGLASGCAAGAITFIGVPPPLTLNITASSPSVCIGDVITLTAINSGGTPGYIYNWSTGPSTNTFIANETIGGTYIYTVTATDANNCSATNSFSLIFFNAVSLISPTISICPGAIGTLTVSGAITYTWNPSGLTGNSFTASPGSASIYSVVGTSSAGCVGQVTTAITIKPTPALSFVTYTITCGNLGSATVTANGGIGPFSYTWTPTSQTGSVATGLFPGTYTISVFDGATGCVFTPTTNFAALVPLTGTISSTGSLVCNGATTGTAGIALAGGSGSQTYTWTNPAGAQNTFTANNLSAGVHTVSVVDALTFCQLTQTFLITQPSAFTLNIAASAPSVCLGSVISYTALNSGGTPGYTYTWTVGPPSINIFTVSETSAGIYTYVVNSTDASNCSTSNSVTGKFVVNPVVSVSDVSICPLAVGSLTALGAQTYSWSNGSQLNPMNTSPPSTTQYTVTGSAAGCTATAMASIILKPVPTVSFASFSQLCQGDSLYMISLNSHSLYLWSGPLSFSSAGAAITIHSVIPTNSGNYTLKVTAANSCTASITKSITVHPTPVVSVSGSTVCEGAGLQLSASYLQGATYLWSGPFGNTSASQITTFSASVPAMSGLYSLTVTSAAGCTNVAATQASVIARPVPTISTNNQFCVGSTLQLNGSGGSTYNWFGPGFFSSALQNPVIQNIGFGASGTYSLYAYTGPCFGIDTKTITIFPLPLPTATNNGPVCEFQNVFLSSISSAQSHNWTGPAGFGSSQGNPVIPSVQLANAGIYTLSITDVNNCIGKTTTSLSILPAPTAVANNATVCIGSVATLSASGGVSYSWSGPAAYSSTLSTAFIAVVNLSNTGNYNLVVTGANACTASLVVQLTGLAYPLPLATIAAPSKACINSKITLQGSGGVAYDWVGPANYSATGQQVSVNVNDSTVAGIYTLSVKNNSNCIGTSTVVISVHPLPRGQVQSSLNNLCVPFCSSLSLNVLPGSAPLLNANFNINDRNYLSSGINYCFNIPGTHTVNVNFKDSNNCVNTASLLVNAYPKPNAGFEYTPAQPLAGIDRVQFFNSSNDAGYTEWSWFLQGNDSDVVKEKDPSKLFENAGNYPVVLVAKNQWGCIDTVIRLVIIDDEFAIYVPNVFTPNGDGLNDLFQPKGTGINKYKIEIYNRWGERIFASNDFNAPWDGRFKGEECKTDSYIWILEMTDSKGKRQSYKGYIDLMRAAIKEEY